MSARAVVLLLGLLPAHGDPAMAPPMMLGEPPPPPPALVAGLRSLLSGLEGCDAPCFERAEDWFEQAAKWGARCVASMVRLGLADSFVGALALGREGEAEVRRRLSTVKTTVTPEPKQHDEL